jgi:Raf kinase inhibitor-like YbhB/YbcL family protein
VIRAAAALVALAVAGVAGCEDEQGEPEMTTPVTITVSSSAFDDGQPVPVRYTCDGENVSPPLSWQDLPSGTRSVALVVDDPDAPRGTFVHWVLLDLPPGTTSLTEGVVPAAAVQANNSAGKASYTGPCPPSGTHHYRFTVHALSEPTRLRDGAKLDQALQAIATTGVARGRLVGTYAR